MRAPSLSIQTANGVVKPDILPTKRRHALLLEHHLMDGVAGKDVTHRRAPLNGQLREVEVYDKLLEPWAWLEVHL